MIQSCHEDYEPRELIGEIQKLRNSEESVSDLIGKYLKYSALLVKSPIALYLVQENSTSWMVKGTYGFKDTDKEPLDDAVNFALSLSARTIKNKFAYERLSVPWLDFHSEMALAVKVEDRKKDHTFIYFVIPYKNQQLLSEMLVRTLMNNDIPSFFSRKAKEDQGDIEENKLKLNKDIVFLENRNEHSTDVLEILSNIIFQKKFLLASMFLVNEVATRFHCSQVSIGWEKGSYIDVVAISHVEKFEKHTKSIHLLEALFEESADQDKEILYPLEEIDESIVFAHHHYLEKSKAKQVLSLPFRYEGHVVGVLSCEKKEGIFTEEEVVLLRLLTNYVTPWLEGIHHQDRWFIKRISSKIGNSLKSFFGFKNTFLKLISVIFSLLIIYGLLGTWTYKVETVTTLETDNVVFISAPFNGFVEKVKVHPGDRVQEGDTLLVFDKEELYLKESESLADIGKYNTESEKARADAKLADMRIALSKKREAQLNLERVKYYLKRSEITAPFEGVVIAGDREELLGAPTSKGDLLFKVAQSTELYLKLKIPEKEIDDINISLEGEFSLLSSPNKKYHFKIENIMPLATVDKTEGNVFVGHAVIVDDIELWWRPGMSGVAKIEVGERNILWILTHDMVEFLRMYFWI